MRVFLAVLLLACSTAFGAAPLPGLDDYARGDYAGAARSLKTALDTKKLSASDAITARMYLAASYFSLGANESAESALGELFRVSPQARLSPDIFDPDLVAMSDKVRAVEEKRRAEALAKQPAQPAKGPVVASVPVEEKPAEIESPAEGSNAPSAVQLRVGIFALTDVAGKPSATGALMVSVLISRLELGLRAFPGGWRDSAGNNHLSLGVGAEVAHLFGDGALHPRAGVRFTFYPSLSDGAEGATTGLGGGAVVGVRYALTRLISLAADVSGELNSVGSSNRYRGFSVVLGLGAQFVF